MTTNPTREAMLDALADYVQTARDGDAGSLEEAVPGDLDGFLADVALWVRAHPAVTD